MSAHRKSDQHSIRQKGSNAFVAVGVLLLKTQMQLNKHSEPHTAYSRCVLLANLTSNIIWYLGGMLK